MVDAVVKAKHVETIFTAMSLAKEFSEEQKATVQSWADDGAGLSDIQKRLSNEMDIRVTYMELRFLLDDLGVSLKETPTPEPWEEKAPSPESELLSGADGNDVPTGDGVRISISSVQRPGALISGVATFAGGQQVEWWLDQMGQLGMNPKDEDFRPSQEQMMSFQRELQKTVQEKGGF